MRRRSGGVRVADLSQLLCLLALLVLAGAPEAVRAQAPTDAGSFDAPQSAAAQENAVAPPQAQPASDSSDFGVPENEVQTKRILFFIPNFRSVSADQELPPQTAKEKFELMAQDSFDYSSFLYVGVLSGIADWQYSYPLFGHGAAGYARYYWHAFADNAGGNLMTEALTPIVTHEDPRYYTLGHGGFFRRSFYSVTRLVVTRTDMRPDGSAGETFNASEIIGNGAASGFSNLYYPSAYRTWTKTGQKWLLQVGLDGCSDIVKEFWPDINSRVFHTQD
jgi:hypothetical protein